MGSREIWKDIDDFTGYQISNKGRVRSFHKYKMGQNKEADALVETPHIMRTTSDNGCGYLKVMLRRNGKSYCRKIHRLVAKAFVSNPYDYDTVDHISNNKVDDRKTCNGSQEEKTLVKLIGTVFTIAIFEVDSNSAHW